MNYANVREDVMDRMPSKESFKGNKDYNYRGTGNNFPYCRFKRWLESKEGNDIDDISSEYIKLKWIPVEYRRVSSLSRYVEMNTFMVGDKVAYYSDSCMDIWIVGESNYRKEYYVDPCSYKLCIFRPRKVVYKREDDNVRVIGEYHQYNRVNGIWYEVKAEVVDNKEGNNVGYMYSCKGPKDNLMESSNRYDNEYSNKPYVRVIMKRQLSREELRDNGLRNG